MLHCLYNCHGRSCLDSFWLAGLIEIWADDRDNTTTGRVVVISECGVIFHVFNVMFVKVMNFLCNPADSVLSGS